MKVLFFMRHSGYARNFESTLRRLAERGHQIHLALDVVKRRDIELEGNVNIVERLCAEFPNISHGPAPDRRSDGWVKLGKSLRSGIDCLRYRHPRYRDAARLRARAEEDAPWVVRTLARSPLSRSSGLLALLDRALRGLESSVPIRPEIFALIEEQRPDIVLVTPLVESRSPQPDYVRAARGLGVPAGLCVCSWDNLTNKGLIRGELDLVTVWNRAMAREAVELHGVPAGRVAVTGAPTFDEWFARGPSTTREEFCRAVGLPAERPYLLYLCSSRFIAPAPREVGWVERWLAGLRALGDAGVRGCGVLVRPHPQNAGQWVGWAAAGEPGEVGPVVVWPMEGAGPVDGGSKAAFYDSIYHSAAVVGMNTSALIEAAIVGRGVYTVLAEEFRDTQGGTLHFRHLERAGGGLLVVAGSLGEHAEQVGAGLVGRGGEGERNRRFLEAFVRPGGLGVEATGALVGAIEAAAGAGAGRRAVGAPGWAPGVRLLLAPLAYYLRWGDRWWRPPSRLARRGARAGLRTGRRLLPVRVRLACEAAVRLALVRR